jgi:methyl-accepting chemotaxis protein
VEEAAAAAGSLKDQSTKLQNVVSMFKTSGYAATAVTAPAVLTHAVKLPVRAATTKDWAKPKALKPNKPALGLKRPTLSDTKFAPAKKSPMGSTKDISAVKPSPVSDDDWVEF